jgi:chromosome segregation ATPase
MEARIKSMSLKNFKGIAQKEVSFEKETIIKGRNATGKSTIMDAFLWCLLGTDSLGRTDFNIKTLNSTGKAISQIDHSVECTLAIDGRETTLHRLYREKWVKPRGKAEAEFSGHETVCHIDGVPVTVREYTSTVTQLVPGYLFKMLTSPMHFPSLSWQDQREMVFELAGEVSEEELNLSPAVRAMRKEMEGKDLNLYKREIAASKRKIKEELDHIPARIDEVSLMPATYDWEEIKAEIEKESKALDSLNASLLDKSRQMEASAGEVRQLQADINILKTRCQAIEFDTEFRLNKDYNEAMASREKLTEDAARATTRSGIIESSISSSKKKLEEYSEKRERLINEWRSISSEKFEMDENELKCPTCQRYFEDSDLITKRKELEENFQAEKKRKIEDNVATGKIVAQNIEELREEIRLAETELSKVIAQIKTYNTLLLEVAVPEKKDVAVALAENTEYQDAHRDIKRLQEQIEKTTPTDALEDYKERSQVINDRIKDLQGKLMNRGIIEGLTERRNALIARQKELSGELAALERIEYLIKEYTKARVDFIEERVNSMFTIVRFKLFDIQVNGEEVDTCQLTIKGVPYSDLNHAGKIQGGMDIIKTLSAHYNYFLPVWIDNAEAINEIPEVNSQVIKLYVTEDENLIIN